MTELRPLFHLKADTKNASKAEQPGQEGQLKAATWRSQQEQKETKTLCDDTVDCFKGTVQICGSGVLWNN